MFDSIGEEIIEKYQNPAVTMREYGIVHPDLEIIGLEKGKFERDWKISSDQIREWFPDGIYGLFEGLRNNQYSILSTIECDPSVMYITLINPEKETILDIIIESEEKEPYQNLNKWL